MPRPAPLWFIFALTVTGIMSNSLVTPALPNVLDDLGVADERAGLVVASGSIAGIAIAPVVGLLADRFGRRIVITTCLTIFGVFGGVAAAAPNLPVLLLARFAQGFGSAGLINLAVVLIGDNYEGEARTRLVGRNSAVLTMGLATLPLLSGAVTEVVSWRATFCIYLVALIMAPTCWRLVPPRRLEAPPALRDQLRGATDVIRTPLVMLTLLAAFLVFFAIFGLFLTVLPLHLEDEFGLNAFTRGLFLSVPALTATLSAFNLARIRRVFGVRQILLLAALGFGIGFPLLGIAPALGVLAIGAMVYGLAEGVFIPSVQELAMDAAPAEHRGSTMAVWTSAARLGQSLGPVLGSSALALAASGTILVSGAGLAALVAVIALVLPLGALATGALRPGSGTSPTAPIDREAGGS